VKNILLIILFIIVICASAQKKDSLGFKIGVLPSVFYTPETRLGFGTLIYTKFSLDKNNVATKKSNSQSYVNYTLNNQFSFENDYQIWTKNNAVFLTGALNFSRFPEFFYGIGNNTDVKQKQTISFDISKITSKVLFQLNKNKYVGVHYQHQYLFNVDKETVNKYDNMCETVIGINGFKASGIGPALIIDNRDNPLNPQKGYYLESSYQFFNQALGSNQTFSSFVIDTRIYKTVFKKLVWNANVYAHLTNGDVPFRMLPAIGGARFLRGYYQGRFRDKNLLLLQQEFRLPIYKRIGIAAFGGIGAVSQNKNDFIKKEIHYNYGVGLRIQINKNEKTNVRIDYGITKDSQGIYVVFAEAF
jgi:Omp85 superfamily domain